MYEAFSMLLFSFAPRNEFPAIIIASSSYVAEENRFYVAPVPSPSATTADADVPVQPPGNVLPVQVQRVEGHHPGAGAACSSQKSAF